MQSTAKNTIQKNRKKNWEWLRVYTGYSISSSWFIIIMRNYFPEIAKQHINGLSKYHASQIQQLSTSI
jgi:hypothetical protein